MLDKIKEVLPGINKTPAGPSGTAEIDEKRDDITVTQQATSSDIEKSGGDSSDAEIHKQEYQAGVQEIEAALTVWTKWHLVAAYGMIWLIYFITSIEEVVVRTFSPFVTSSFSSHSLTATTSIMSSVIAGLTKLPLAKILDIWGRPQGMALMLLIWTLGFIMMAACKNVFTYAAAQVFSTVGSQGISYCLTVFIADTSSLKSRGLMLAFATSPYIVTTWIGGPMGDALVRGAGWRWGFGIFSIITPVVVLPLIILFWVQLHRAKKQGLVSKRRPEISPRATYRFCIDMDLVGVILLAAAMALILVPCSIGFKQKLGWKDPKIIAMTVVGGVLLCIFAAYEKFLAPVNFVPFSSLSDRTIFFAGLMLFFLFFNSAVWGSYFTSMLMVVWNQSVTKATYISNIYRVGSCFSSLILGYFMRVTGRFKWVALYFGMPLMLLGVGLMIHFRRPDAEIGYVVMTQIFVAFAGGPLVVAAEMAFMAPVTHQNIASILAILDLFSSIGYAVGATVSSAIWTGCFPDALRKHLPPGANIEYIYSSIYTQLGYPVGTEIRKGISWAYADAQRYMVITSTCALAVGWICVWFWRDIKVKERKQVGGNVA